MLRYKSWQNSKEGRNISKIWLILTILICISLVACINSNADLPTSTKRTSPTPQLTKTITGYLHTPSPSPTSTFSLPPTNETTQSLTPIDTLEPFSKKGFILNYTVSGYHSFYDSILDWHWSRLVLYSDGEMIISGDPYLYKMLSKKEVTQFFTELEALGFFSLESNQHHDPSDQLYDFGDEYVRSYDGLYFCVETFVEKGRNICAHEPSQEYLIPEMKDILLFLDEYRTEDMSIYFPERLLLHVRIGRNPLDYSLPEKAIQWPENLPSLEIPGGNFLFDEATIGGKILYFEGVEAKEIYAFLIEPNSNDLFIHNDVEYTVYHQVVLPHKEIYYHKE